MQDVFCSQILFTSLYMYTKAGAGGILIVLIYLTCTPDCRVIHILRDADEITGKLITKTQEHLLVNSCGCNPSHCRSTVYP